MAARQGVGMSRLTRPNLDLLFGQTETALPLEWRLNWNWNWPLWATLLAVVVAAVWVMAIYYRETSTAGRKMRLLLSCLRLTALAVVLLMFAQPTLEWFRTARPRLILLVDRSASMGTLDRYPRQTKDISRLQAWQDFLLREQSQLVSQWQADYELDIVTFDEQIEPLETKETTFVEQLQSLQLADDQASGTRLGDAVDYALRELPGAPPVALIVLTDGIATRGQTLQQAAERARQLRVPLYTVAVGSDRVRPDIAVENLLIEEIIFPGDRLQVEATVRATGFAGKPVDVVLRDTSTQSVLAQTSLKLPADQATEIVRLSIRPSEPGPLSLEIGVEPLADETNTENNTAAQVVDVRDEKIRVLLVQSQPSYEYRALKSLLERDPAVELRVRLQEADADYPSVDDTALRAFPTSEQALFDYDVLLLGDADLGLLPSSVWPLIERFVAEHGGGLVGIAGPRFMPLAYRGNRPLEVLLPMKMNSLNPLHSQLGGSETFAIYPTVLGWRTPSLQLGETTAESERIWNALPPVSWLLRIEDVKPGAQVLAEHPGLSNRQGQRLPVILRHYVGAGEVLFHATDETWRWRWRTDDRYFARYWGQVVRRLGRGRLASGRLGVQLSVDRFLYEPGEPVQLQVRFRNPSQAPAADDQVVVQLQRNIGPPREVTLQRRLGRRGLFAGSVEELAPGEYEALLVQPNLGGPTEVARFEIRLPPRELSQLVADRRGLSEAAEISGGKFFTIEEASLLSEQLPAPRQLAVDAQPPRSLWNTHVLVALFVIVLTSEWILRRRYGML